MNRVTIGCYKDNPEVLTSSINDIITSFCDLIIE